MVRTIRFHLDENCDPRIATGIQLFGKGKGLISVGTWWATLAFQTPRAYDTGAVRFHF
jgi:hypothetical protein